MRLQDEPFAGWHRCARGAWAAALLVAAGLAGPGLALAQAVDPPALADQVLVGRVIDWRLVPDPAACQALCTPASGCGGYTFYRAGHLPKEQRQNCGLFGAPVSGQVTPWAGAVSCVMPCMPGNAPILVQAPVRTELLGRTINTIKPLPPGAIAQLGTPPKSSIQAMPPVGTPAATYCGAPRNVAATALSASSIRLSWAWDAGCSAVVLERAGAAGGPWVELGRTPTGAPYNATGSWTDSGLSAATAYHYRLRSLSTSPRWLDSGYYSEAVGASTPAAGGGTGSGSGGGTLTLRATADALVIASTAQPSNEQVNLGRDFNTVGCFYNWVVGPSGTGYFHNCGVSLIRFDTSSLAGRSIRSAVLELTPCQLAQGYLGATAHPSTGQLDPSSAAQYLVRALAGPWSAGTVTFRTLPRVYTDGAWSFPAPTTTARQQLDVTAIVRRWAAGTWADNGLVIEQSPIQDLRSFTYSGRTWDSQDQQTHYCSLENNAGTPANLPTLIVQP